MRRRIGGKSSPFATGGVTVIRFWMNGCGACAMSEKAWTDFKKVSGTKTVEIERAAISPQWDSEIKAFPTYVVVDHNGKKLKKKTGAITDPAKLVQFVKMRSRHTKRRG
jgi:tartrate dehydratase beta subunit/fumarate hydratase class I family protein